MNILQKLKDRKIEKITDSLYKLDSVLHEVDHIENEIPIGYRVEFNLNCEDPLLSTLIVKTNKSVYDDNGEINGTSGNLIGYIDEYIEVPLSSFDLKLRDLKEISKEDLIEYANQLWSSYSSYSNVVYSDNTVFF